MFTAIDTETGEYVEIIQVSGDTLDALRQRGRAGQLICRECRTPASVKAGKRYRWHFAHWQAGKCPLANESPHVLAARLALCEWLRGKWPTGVRMEHRPEGASTLPRPVDVWVETPGGSKFAYWVTGRRVKVDHVRGVIGDAKAAGATLHWVISSKLRRWFDGERLSVIEQYCLDDATEWDGLHCRGRHHGSLYYFDAGTHTFQTVRAVTPTVEGYFRGKPLAASLPEMQVSPLTGTPIHPTEGEWVRQLQQRKREAAAHAGGVSDRGTIA